ncbi:hypothetical protein MALL_0058 [Mycoplasmopsis alligatoris A21JP2]|uniref:Uncharacterized protein n=2 Tax=Mycoplasmopsis alligatoris TaxID=47687 RepID=D4XWA2_9BACT|nr:hypothetical protein MALL_0058 [Mycoplasmopsis alligatoris A21JP2]
MPNFGDRYKSDNNLKYELFIDDKKTDQYTESSNIFKITKTQANNGSKVKVKISNRLNEDQFIWSTEATIYINAGSDVLIPLPFTNISKSSTMETNDNMQLNNFDQIDISVTIPDYDKDKYDLTWKLVHNHKVIQKASEKNITLNKKNNKQWWIWILCSFIHS